MISLCVTNVSLSYLTLITSFFSREPWDYRSSPTLYPTNKVSTDHSEILYYSFQHKYFDDFLHNENIKQTGKVGIR